MTHSKYSSAGELLWREEGPMLQLGVFQVLLHEVQGREAVIEAHK